MTLSEQEFTARNDRAEAFKKALGELCRKHKVTMAKDFDGFGEQKKDTIQLEFDSVLWGIDTLNEMLTELEILK